MVAVYMVFQNTGSGGEKMVQCWEKNSDAAKLLKSGLENGDIDPQLPPKQIWESCPIFQQYELTRFRAALNKMKAEIGLHLRKANAANNNNGVESEEKTQPQQNPCQVIQNYSGGKNYDKEEEEEVN